MCRKVIQHPLSDLLAANFREWVTFVSSWHAIAHSAAIQMMAIDVANIGLIVQNPDARKIERHYAEILRGKFRNARSCG
jgi:hypothetical protein